MEKNNTPKLGDVVTYALTPEECENFNKPVGTKIQAVIKQVIKTAAAQPDCALISAEVRPGQPWQKSAFFKNKEGGIVTDQAPTPEKPTTTHTPLPDVNAPIVHTEGLPSGVTSEIAAQFKEGEKY